MPTIDKKNINDSLQNSKKGLNFSYTLKKESCLLKNTQYYIRYIGSKKNTLHSWKSGFGKRRRNRFLFPFSCNSDLRSVNENEIIWDKKKEDNSLKGAQSIIRYLDTIDLKAEKIEFKKTTESYLIEFFRQQNYFLIEIFHDHDIVVLVRDTKSGSRKAWDFTINQIDEVLQVIKQNTTEYQHE